MKTKTGETMTDERKQMNRWVEHYLLPLFSNENTFYEKAL